MICPRCGHGIHEKSHCLCEECYSEICPYGDDVALKQWWAWFNLVNAKSTREELETFIDSKPIQKWFKEALDEMDLKMKVRMLMNWLEEYTK